MNTQVPAPPSDNNAVENKSSDHEFSDLDLAEIWRTILRPGAAEDEQFVNKYFKWRRPISVEGLLLGQPRIWTSWGYKATYPKLAIFLEKASLEDKFRCQIIVEDLETHEDRHERRTFRYNEAHGRLSRVFDGLKTLPTEIDEAKPVCTWRKDQNLMARLSRVLHVTDVSPLVLSCIFGTSSSIDISHIAAFVDRNLNGSNWAKVNLLQIRHLNWSSYIYEYHFSFYYVTLDYFDIGTIKPDLRNARRSCTFGQSKNSKHRYIHEESVSFLLCGHFDVFSCIQLGDAYFKPRYAKDSGPRVFRAYEPNQSPGQFFLYWIAVALFHARSRWENAIDALDAEVTSPSDVVFMEDRNDLMADDPQFSLSKTYFWALQTYKLFERTLQQTVTTWDNFKQDSLPRIRDGRISREDWEAGVVSIDRAIDTLKLKIARVQRGIQDVKDLRESLQSTAAVFDSRTAVRQGENIRLLTYITLLFLPLSFGTGIFGMQIIESSPRAVKAFAITLPTIFVATALIIFNLDTVMAAFNALDRRLTLSLQQQMRLHHRPTWKDRAYALHQDHLSTAPPARKAAKQSSHWVYLLYIVEAATVIIPVLEVNAAVHCYGILSSSDDEKKQENAVTEEPELGSGRHDTKRDEIQRKVERAAKEAREQEQKQKEQEEGVLRSLPRRFLGVCFTWVRTVFHLLINLLRALFVPIWIILLVIEYGLISSALMLLTNHTLVEETSAQGLKNVSSESTPTRSISPFVGAWRILGLNTISLPWRRHQRRENKSTYNLTPRKSQKRFFRNMRHRMNEDFTLQGPPQPPIQLVPRPQSGQYKYEFPRIPGEEHRNPELSTFAVEERSATVNKIWRAARFANHGGGFVPGDFARSEMDPGTSSNFDNPNIGASSPTVVREYHRPISTFSEPPPRERKIVTEK
ncbi:hypothetical protein B0J14DRAFT_295896 [Halenospora varia]|nr:hypothetical protein B0J14DRAFT_295896 [Halenospora varia]